MNDNECIRLAITIRHRLYISNKGHSSYCSPIEYEKAQGCGLMKQFSMFFWSSIHEAVRDLWV